MTVTGPRQSGKTTLVRDTFPDHEYVSLEDTDNYDFAQSDPRGFLTRYRGGAIFDEAQRTPHLFSYLQTNVDEDATLGRFILSGSQNFLLLQSITQSLAGRTAILHLMPLSLTELQSRPPLSVRDLGRSFSSDPVPSDGTLFETMFRGFYPRVHDTADDVAAWYRDYIATYVERDVRQIDGVGDLRTFRSVMQLAAGRNGGLLNLSSLASDAGVSRTTVARWLSILETSFLIVFLTPYSRNIGRRVVRRPKIYFLDTGLLCSLLGIRAPEHLFTHPARGAVFESLVFSELMKSRLHAGDPPDLHFYRDQSGLEVDFLFEDGPTLTGIEAKSGDTIGSDFLVGLHRWRRVIEQPDAPAALIYGGNDNAVRENVHIYSWRNL